MNNNITTQRFLDGVDIYPFEKNLNRLRELLRQLTWKYEELTHVWAIFNAWNSLSPVQEQKLIDTNTTNIVNTQLASMSRDVITTVWALMIDPPSSIRNVFEYLQSSSFVSDLKTMYVARAQYYGSNKYLDESYGTVVLSQADRKIVAARNIKRETDNIDDTFLKAQRKFQIVDSFYKNGSLLKDITIFRNHWSAHLSKKPEDIKDRSLPYVQVHEAVTAAASLFEALNAIVNMADTEKFNYYSSDKMQEVKAALKLLLT